MPKVLVELKNGDVINVEATSEDVEVYIVDHDVISEGSRAEQKRYLANLDVPVEVDGVMLEEDLMARLEELMAKGKAGLEDMAHAWEDESDDMEELPDLTTVVRHRR